MHSNSSKPSSDAGLRPIGEYLSNAAAIAQAAPARLGSCLNHIDKQTAAACQPSNLAGRHKAPTWGPTQWGGEGTTSREVAPCPAGSPPQLANGCTLRATGAQRLSRPKNLKERLQWMADNLPGFREELAQVNAIQRQSTFLRA